MNFEDEIKESVHVFSQFLEEEEYHDEFYYGARTSERCHRTDRKSREIS